MGKPTPKHARDNRANQLNPNHDAYWQSRGLSAPPQSASAPSPPAEPSPRQPADPKPRRTSD